MSAVNKEIVDFDVMIEVDADTTIYGFAKFGTTSFEDDKWALLQEKTIGNITTRKWADGSKVKKFVLSDYENIDFKFIQ